MIAPNLISPEREMVIDFAVDLVLRSGFVQRQQYKNSVLILSFDQAYVESDELTLKALFTRLTHFGGFSMAVWGRTYTYNAPTSKENISKWKSDLWNIIERLETRHRALMETGAPRPICRPEAKFTYEYADRLNDMVLAYYYSGKHGAHSVHKALRLYNVFVAFCKTSSLPFALTIDEDTGRSCITLTDATLGTFPYIEKPIVVVITHDQLALTPDNIATGIQEYLHKTCCALVERIGSAANVFSGKYIRLADARWPVVLLEQIYTAVAGLEANPLRYLDWYVHTWVELRSIYQDKVNTNTDLHSDFRTPEKAIDVRYTKDETIADVKVDYPIFVPGQPGYALLLHPQYAQSVFCQLPSEIIAIIVKDVAEKHLGDLAHCPKKFILTHYRESRKRAPIARIKDSPVRPKNSGKGYKRKMFVVID